MGSFSNFPEGSRLARSAFDRANDAYSATDIQAVVYGTDKTTGNNVAVQIGDIQTLSYSCHIDKSPVRTLGRKNPRQYTSGARTTAGSLIFATFNKRALFELYTGAASLVNVRDNVSDAKILQPSDTIPPFDIILYFTSEGGNDSVLTLYRVELGDEGQTFSVQDIYTEHTMQYVCSGISLMEKIDDAWTRGYMATQGVFKNVALTRRATANGLNV